MKDLQTHKSTGSEIVSGTTGSAFPEQREPNATGPQRGEIMSALILPNAKLAEMDTREVEARLKTKLVELLGPRCESLLATKEMVSSECVVTGYAPLGIDTDLAANAWQVLAKACAPAPRKNVAVGLSKARAMTKRRKEDDVNEELTQLAYIELFEKWPADVSMRVIGGMHRIDGGWWPSAASVENELRFYGSGRLALRDAMKAAADADAKGEQPKPVNTGPAGLARMAELLAFENGIEYTEGMTVTEVLALVMRKKND